MTETATTVTIDEMLATGASYRQLDYWARSEYLKPEHGKRGQGTRRTWPRSEHAVATNIVRLLTVGVELATAAKIARQAVESGTNRVDLGNGVVISLEAS